MQEYPQNVPPVQEEDSFDYVALLKGLWAGRKTIIITFCVFVVLGLVAALTMKRTYTVTTVMFPQMSGKSNSSLSSLASLAGVNLNQSTGGEIPALAYPQIVNSVPYRLELIRTPLHYEKVATPVSLLEYATEYARPSVFGTIKKYTIGLPGVILGALRKEKEIALPAESGEDGEPKPMVLTKDEQKVLENLSQSISLSVDKKEGYLTLSVIGSEPLQTAELALKAQHLLQEEVTRLGTEKAQSELEYIQARYDEIKAEAESYQTALAAATDRSQDLASNRSRIARDRIQSKYTLANSIYNDMARQLEMAKMQVKKDTPVYTILQPVVVPSKPSNSRAKTLAVWLFMGVVVGCGLVMVKMYYPKVKEKFTSAA